MRGLAIIPLLLGIGAIATMTAFFDLYDNQATGWFLGTVALLAGALAGWIARAPGFKPVAN